MKFGDNFPTEYFKGDSMIKSSFISTNIDDECVSECRDELIKLINATEISDFSKSFIHKCYEGLNDLFFLLPTSTGGKYHGGLLSAENSVGGLINHYLRVLKVSQRVIHRYQGVLNRNSLSEFNNYVEVLRVAILLHDIGRLGADGSSFYSDKLHGEIGSEIISSCFFSFYPKCPFEFFSEPLTYAVYNHMYLWKFCNVYDQLLIPPFSPSLVVGLMLSESDFFSTVY